MGTPRENPTPRPAPQRESGIRLVCFDWGGVLLRHHRAWKDGCAAAGLPVRGGSDTPQATVRRRAASLDFQIGRIGEGEFFQRLRGAVDGAYSIDELRRIHDAWLIDEYPGVDAVVRRLAGTPGVETALLSNTNEAHWRRHMPHHGRPADFPTPGLLTHRHASHLLGLAKPGEEIYRAFERIVGYGGREILFFDDLAENVDAARRVGWRAEVIDHEGEPARQIADGLISYGVWTG